MHLAESALVSAPARKCYTRKEMIAANLAVERNGRISDWFYDRVSYHDEQGELLLWSNY